MKIGAGLLLLSLAVPAFAGTWNSLFNPDSLTPLTRYTLRAYSEFMPAPEFGVLPYERFEKGLDLASRLKPHYSPSSPEGFGIPAFEETTQLRPALKFLAEHWLTDLAQLVDGEKAGGNKLKGIPAELLKDNPFWSKTLPQKTGPIVSFTALALSKTQDDHGRTPWTVFGESEAGSETVFWASLPTPGAPWLNAFFEKVFGDGGKFQILSSQALSPELEAFRWKETSTARFVITFTPIQNWPESLREGYEKGRVAVVPHPSTLIFSGSPVYRKLAETNPEALQLPLAREFSQFGANRGLRVLKVHALVNSQLRKQWRRRFSHSTEAETDFETLEDPLSAPTTPFDLIFNDGPEVTGLYGKPVARNVQIWGVKGRSEGQWILNGPDADREAIAEANRIIQNQVAESASVLRFFYRDYFPPLQINGFKIIWHRPLIAWRTRDGKTEIDPSLLGQVRATNPTETVSLKPTIVGDGGKTGDGASDLLVLSREKKAPHWNTAWNVQKLTEFSDVLGEPLSQEMAEVLITPNLRWPKSFSPYAKWAARISKKSEALAMRLSKTVAAGKKTARFVPLTFSDTVDGDGAYEERYWRSLTALSRVDFQNKNNVDCVSGADDAPDEIKAGHCHENQLPSLATNFLAPYYQALGLEVGAHLIPWETDFGFAWWKGLSATHQNLVVVIPGENHSEAVIMADHYDTAFEEDVYDKGTEAITKTANEDLKKHRHASEGADDNHSATAALMEAARVLSQKKLKRDVWLVHLTGEEFPSDCLGARTLSEALVTGQTVFPGKANPKIVGVYVLDMVAHHTDRDHHPNAQAVFQIAVGKGEKAVQLAQAAHRATVTWNDFAEKAEGSWKVRKHRKRGGTLGTEAEPFPKFRGEIRPGWHYRSALYNTDGQIFSDAGIPVVLFMENYDINRGGYHDTNDTLENIDLDYGAGLTRIAIESVAQKANE